MSTRLQSKADTAWPSCSSTNKPYTGRFERFPFSGAVLYDRESASHTMIVCETVSASALEVAIHYGEASCHNWAHALAATGSGKDVDVGIWLSLATLVLQ